MARPNIVFIVADDMGYGDFGCFNYGASRTPALDRLAAEGLCLSQHYSACPMCAPARATLYTGRYPHRTGCIDTIEVNGMDRLALRETTIADLLRRAGYATGLVGKWHNGAGDPRYHPNARGFDEFAGFRAGGMDYFDWRIEVGGRPRRADGRYLTDVFTDEAVAFLRRHRKRPFFLNVTYSAPHEPFQAPDEDVRPFLETGSFNRGVSTLYGMLRVLDRGVERIVGELDRLGLTDNTLLLFTSDNGPQFGGAGDGEWDTTRFNCGFRGRKGLVYEGGIRVPMLIRWPAGLDGGRAVHQMTHFADWLPTLLAVAGAEPPAELDLDGVDVLPVLQGEPARVSPVRFWQWNRYVPVGVCNAAMRDGPWKLVRPAIAAMIERNREFSRLDRAYTAHPEEYPDGPPRAVPPDYEVPDPPPAPELYNLDADPMEQRDLAAEHPDRAARMARALETWFETVEAERAAIRDE